MKKLKWALALLFAIGAFLAATRQSWMLLLLRREDKKGKRG